MNTIKTILNLSFVCICVGATLGCAPFRDSPYSDNILRQERNLNTKALEKLGAIEGDGKIRFAVITDSHQNYKSLDDVIYEINQTPDLDFVVHLGDFTNSSYNFEYDQFLDSYITLMPPAFTVTGNHDAIGAGPALFRKVFGLNNFFFESPSKRFIFFNTANLEDPESFDPKWLRQTVSASSKPVIIFSHVELRDEERYFGQDAQYFDEVIKDPKTQVVFNGHNHVYRLLMDNGTVLLQAPRVESGWMLIEIQGNQLQMKLSTGEEEWLTLKN